MKAPTATLSVSSRSPLPGTIPKKAIRFLKVNEMFIIKHYIVVLGVQQQWRRVSSINLKNNNNGIGFPSHYLLHTLTHFLMNFIVTYALAVVVFKLCLLLLILFKAHRSDGTFINMGLKKREEME